MKKVLIIAAIAGISLVGIFLMFRMYTKSHSPAETVSFDDGNLKMEITYCRPSKKGREIFGGLEPYGAVWRTGANEATEITISRDVFIGNQELKAGTYAFFTIPEKDKWTVIFNSELGQWGAFTYDKKKDVLRTYAVPVTLPEVVELLTIKFNPISNGAELTLAWDRTSISIPMLWSTEPAIREKGAQQGYSFLKPRPNC